MFLVHIGSLYVAHLDYSDKWKNDSEYPGEMMTPVLTNFVFELELIQTHMTQEPLLWVEVGKGA
jgi:hypothetical protein